MTIYVLSPDNDRPSGGIKILYRHVDVLNHNGIDAVLLHQQSGFRCTWFDNETRVECLANVCMGRNDFLVIPEIFGPNMTELRRSPNIGSEVRKLIFNQNCRYTFLGQTLASISAPSFDIAYQYDDEFIATIVVSEDSRNYLEYVFPNMPVWRIHNAIDCNIFRYVGEKKRQICFMPRKNANDALQVLAILKCRDVLRDFTIVPIENANEAGVAAIMAESMFFLSFGYPEGCPLPPAEAMASGCIVIGYDGFGGQEYFKEEFSRPIAIGDITGFAAEVERQIECWSIQPESIYTMGRAGAEYVCQVYSSEQEQEDILVLWNHLLSL